MPVSRLVVAAALAFVVGPRVVRAQPARTPGAAAVDAHGGGERGHDTQPRGGTATADEARGAATADDAPGAATADEAMAIPVAGADRGARMRARITATTFGYRETSAASSATNGDGGAIEDASPVSRLFTDLRAQLRGDRLLGGRWAVEVDVRARWVRRGRATSGRLDDNGATIRTQSGMLGHSELELRGVEVRRRGARTDWVAGRQVVTSVGATTIDGVRFEHRASARWTLVGFGGLYPMRGSRSVADDYPRQAPDPAVDAGPRGPRVVPVVAGGGAAYRTARGHGAVGAGIIIPVQGPTVGAHREPPRAFVTTSGIWHPAGAVDVYHDVVLDMQGDGVTNRDTDDPCSGRCRTLVLGARWRLRPSLHVTGSVSEVDTEAISAQTKALLEEPDRADSGAGARIQNNVDVLRVASQAARLAVSAGLCAGRFELSVGGTLRRRPSFAVTGTDGTPFEFPRTQAAEVTVSAMDRRFARAWRLSASVSSMFGLGAHHLNQATAHTAQLAAARRFAGDHGELELDVRVIRSEDDGRAAGTTACLPGTLSPLDCYGTSAAVSTSAGALVFYQVSARVFAVVSLRVGALDLTITDGGGERDALARLWSTTGLVRVDYTWR